MYLIDTDIISLTRRIDRHPQLKQSLSGLIRKRAYLSVVSIGEIEHGIVRQQKNDPAFAKLLGDWLAGLRMTFVHRILPISEEIAVEWGRLTARIGHQGTDLFIAATAITNDLTVITRNVKHFTPTGVPVFNPFDPQPPSTVQ